MDGILPFHHRETQCITIQEALHPDVSRIRVMSYNILADEYAQGHSRELYSSVPWQALQWKTRVSMIAREVAHWSPDIVCFQEVDHYQDLERLLRPYGYRGSYLQRTNDRLDGLATFWKENRFAVHTEHRLKFAELGLRDNVTQITLLKEMHSDSSQRAHTLFSHKNTKSQQRNDQSAACIDDDVIIVANIHVLFNPKRGDIKIAQVRIMLEEAYRLAKELSGTMLVDREECQNSYDDSDMCPILVCGDFNSAAGSPLYKFITDSALDLNTTDRRRLSGQVEVAGRTGWPSLQSTFLNAIQDGHDEQQALCMAIGALPKYNSMMDPYNSMRDPETVAVLDGGEHRSADDNGTKPIDAMGTYTSQHRMREWDEDDLDVALGTGTHEYGRIVMMKFEERMKRMTDDNVEELKSNVNTAKHPLKLQSAYHSVTGSEPLYTTVHDKYVGTVDYIFYTPSRLKPLHVLLPPPLSTLRDGLPSTEWPSDHVCLVAEFERKG